MGGQAVDDLGDSLTHGCVELPQRAAGARPDIDGVGGHVRQPTDQALPWLGRQATAAAPGRSGGPPRHGDDHCVNRPRIARLYAIPTVSFMTGPYPQTVSNVPETPPSPSL
jgi:hypothetical protein